MIRTAPDVSVVIPAFNAERFLQRAVASVRAQTCGAFEIVVVDDGSTDGTAALAERLREEDDRIIVVRLPANRGVAAARNAALAIARGAWIAPLDADDAFAPARLETLLREARALHADMLADNLRICEAGRPAALAFDPDVVVRSRPMSLARFITLDQPHRLRTAIGYMQPIIRRAFLLQHVLRYDETLIIGEDFDLYARAIARGARLHFVPDAYYDVTVRNESLSRGTPPGPLLASFATSTKKLVREAMRRGDLHAISLLRRRYADKAHAPRYGLCVEAFRSGDLRRGVGMFAGLAFKGYTWRRVCRTGMRRLSSGSIRRAFTVSQRTRASFSAAETAEER